MNAQSRSLRILGVLALAVALSLAVVAPASAQDDLAQGFQQPPPSARPWVYWFWLNGNITREGITADLEAMARVGIGGVLIMEVDQGAPVGPVPFAGAEWRELFRFVVSEAHRLGLEVNMNNDAGWNGSGGPWVTPDKAMQKVVWTETEVEGPQRFEDVLPRPEAVAGYYQDITVLAFPAVGDYRIADIEGKSALVRQDRDQPAEFGDAPAGQTIDRDRIVKLGDKMAADGKLTWDVPAGRWTILRLGHTCTGAMNAPAPESGRGLECDKLSKEGAEANFNGFMAHLIRDVGERAGDTLVATHVDSWENGSQNWTPRFREAFKELRGYDLIDYLPAITGRVVDSLEVSERFLWDWRQTVSDLLVENYAGHIAELAHRAGMRFTIEAYGDTTVDNLAYAGRADEPMGEFWSWPSFGAVGTLTEMASAAHVYGKPIVGAEAFTAGDGEKWLYHPGWIKSMGDRAFCMGINRFVFHRYALQPWKDRRPGMSMGPWGLHYERTQTWWEQSGPYHEYLTRCQYLLQQGLPVVDVLYLAPEGAPRDYNAPPSTHRTGYKGDACPAEVVLERLRVEDGRLVLPDGMSYAALSLPGAATMTPKLLDRLAKLARDGATIVGTPPRKAPGLTDYPRCDAEVRRGARALWESGKVVTGKTAEEVLAARGVAPDFSSDRALDFIHKRIGEADVYFVCNPSKHTVNATCAFRVEGKRPEIWRAETGAIELAPIYVSEGSVTRMPVSFGPDDALFVVFRQPIGKDDPVVRLSSEEGDIWPAPATVAKVTVKRAVWGPAGDASRTKDVTDQVQRMIDKGAETFQVAELASEGDPAFGVVKTLTVEYQVGERSQTASATDPEFITFELPSDAPYPVRLRRTPTGGLWAEASQPGLYTATLRSGKRITFRGAASRYTDILGPWDLGFPPNWGAPEKVKLESLASWSDHPDEGVRYFSGTATYTNTFRLSRGTLGRGRVAYLDLGKVEVMARVRLNGKDLGILWRAPYRVNISNAAKVGDNQLEIEVTNLWPNRMIGDEQLPEDSDRHGNGTLKAWPEWLAGDGPSPTGRFTFTSWRLWAKDSPLQPSGLLGPVRVISVGTTTGESGK
ncbi:MAG TPA: glycosyl hydrolase [Armatimonadota bacterium]|nr:glycosyl hydrolase [Armatimonadota bacterium]